MSTLVLILPPRERIGARAAADADGVAAAGAFDEFDFVYSVDGRSAAKTGRAAPRSLPRSDRVVLVLDDADASWHRLQVPKASSSRMRAALAGAMEEALLDDDAALHFALGPLAAPGQTGWVAAVHRPRLVAVLQWLDEAGHTVDQVVPVSMPAVALPTAPGPRNTNIPGHSQFQSQHHPSANSHVHFFAVAGDKAPRLVIASAVGVGSLSLDGTLSRSLLPAYEDGRWTATPAAAAAAEQWLGAPVVVLTENERALSASRERINLLQFDLAPRRRGWRFVREAGRTFLSPEWRPVRIGLAVFVAVQLVGLNAYAWQQQRTVAGKKVAMNELLRSTHPGVRSVLDAPLQMQRETERLRGAAGRSGGGDLETLLGATAAAWPDGAGPAPTLRFEPGRLILATPGLNEQQLRQFRDRLQSAGYAVESADGRLTITVAKGAL